MKNLEKVKFDKYLKFFISSLTARLCKFIYFNVCSEPNTIVITNADKNLLDLYKPNNLSMHKVTFHDGFYDKLKTFLSIPDNDAYIVRIEIINKAIKQAGVNNVYSSVNVDDKNISLFCEQGVISEEIDIDEEDLEVDENGDVIIQTSSIEEMSLFLYPDTCGVYIENTVVKDTMSLIMEDIANLSSEEFLSSNEYKFYTTSIDTRLERVYSNYIKIHQLDNEKIGITNSNLKNYHLLSIDGSDHPSAKEFFKKLDISEFELLVFKKDLNIGYISKTNTPYFSIVSTRPYSRLMTLRSN